MFKNGIIIVLAIICVALGSYFVFTKQAVVNQNNATGTIVSTKNLKEQYSGYVINVLDGDSVVILDDNKQQLNIRLGEIDAPEYDQPFGNQAKEVLAELVLNKTVVIKSQVVDKYGRIVGRIYIGQTDVSSELVKKGLAWVYRKYATDKSLYQLEDSAKQANTGLWSLPEAERIEPWVWRHSKQNIPAK